MGDSAGTAEALAGTTGVHPAHGALHRQNHGAGQELRAPDHCEKDLHQVSAALTGLGLHLMCIVRVIHCPLFWHSELSLDSFVDLSDSEPLHDCELHLWLSLSPKGVGSASPFLSR